MDSGQDPSVRLVGVRPARYNCDQSSWMKRFEGTVEEHTLVPPNLLEYREPAASYTVQDSVVILSACQSVRYL